MDALAFAGGWYQLVVAAVIILAACGLMVWFLGTRLGLVHPGHRRQCRHGAGFQHQPGVHHHGGAVHLGQPDRPVGRAAGPVSEEL